MVPSQWIGWFEWTTWFNHYLVHAPLFWCLLQKRLVQNWKWCLVQAPSGVWCMVHGLKQWFRIPPDEIKYMPRSYWMRFCLYFKAVVVLAYDNISAVNQNCARSGCVKGRFTCEGNYFDVLEGKPMSSRALRDWFAGQTNASGPETVCLNLRESLCNYYITFGQPFR